MNIPSRHSRTTQCSKGWYAAFIINSINRKVAKCVSKDVERGYSDTTPLPPPLKTRGLIRYTPAPYLPLSQSDIIFEFSGVNKLWG